MKVIQTKAEIGPDRMLHIALPADMPEGEVDVVVAVEPCGPVRTQAERRAAAAALCGSLKYLGLSVEEFLAERRVDEERREQARVR